jgi:signal transduction histidine kinase
MTVMIAQAEVARALRDDAERSDRALGVVIDTGREALRGMRTVVADEAPRAPLPTIESLVALVEDMRTPSADVRLVETGTRGRLRPDAAVALHHAVREALTNAVRHAAPPVEVEVRLAWSADGLHAAIVDDGGSGSAPSDLGTGIGLVGIAERVRLAGGALTAGEREPRGWAVTVDLPVADLPVSGSSAAELPVNDQYVSDRSVADLPVTGSPVADLRVSDQPVTGSPVADLRVSDQSVPGSPVADPSAPEEGPSA